MSNRKKILVGSSVYKLAANPEVDRQYRDTAEKAYEQFITFLHFKSTEELLQERLVYPWKQAEGVLFWGVDFHKVNSDYPNLRVYIGPDNGKGAKGIHVWLTEKQTSQINIKTLPIEKLRTHHPWGQSLMGPWQQFEAVRDHIPHDIFIHEFIHYLDTMRRKKPYKLKMVDVGEEKAKQKYRQKTMTPDTRHTEYLSSPKEFNAWYQASIQSLEKFLDDVVELFPENLDAHLGTEQKFIDTALKMFNQERPTHKGHPMWKVNLLDEKYRRKLLKRLHGFYDYYVKKIQNE